MVASIAHRATGVALAAGTLMLSWWLIAAATGPEAYGVFARVAANPVGVPIMRTAPRTTSSLDEHGIEQEPRPA